MTFSPRLREHTFPQGTKTFPTGTPFKKIHFKNNFQICTRHHQSQRVITITKVMPTLSAKENPKTFLPTSLRDCTFALAHKRNNPQPEHLQHQATKVEEIAVRVRSDVNYFKKDLHLRSSSEETESEDSSDSDESSEGFESFINEVKSLNLKCSQCLNSNVNSRKKFIINNHTTKYLKMKTQTKQLNDIPAPSDDDPTLRNLVKRGQYVFLSSGKRSIQQIQA